MGVAPDTLEKPYVSPLLNPGCNFDRPPSCVAKLSGGTMPLALLRVCPAPNPRYYCCIISDAEVVLHSLCEAARDFCLLSSLAEEVPLLLVTWRLMLEVGGLRALLSIEEVVCCYSILVCF